MCKFVGIKLANRRLMAKTRLAKPKLSLARGLRFLQLLKRLSGVNGFVQIQDLLEAVCVFKHGLLPFLSAVS